MVSGTDGKFRCPWALAAPEYIRYHDDEWARPVTGEAGLFERLCLEAFQSGLSWLTILRKREAFRSAFEAFDPDAVARFGEPDVRRLLSDVGIVRNRAKIEAAIHNARCVIDLRDGDETLSTLLWSFAGRQRRAPRSLAGVPSSTPESAALARSLKRQGFRFVGPTTAYALMQACGIVNDHLAQCRVREDVERQRRAVVSRT